MKPEDYEEDMEILRGLAEQQERKLRVIEARVREQNELLEATLSDAEIPRSTEEDSAAYDASIEMYTRNGVRFG